MNPRHLSRQAPELPSLHLLLAALNTVDALLLLEHPTVVDPGPNPTPTLRRALYVRAAISTLKRELCGYRRSVRRVLRPRRTYRLRVFRPPPQSS